MPPTKTDARAGSGIAKGALAITASAFGFAVMAAFVRLSDDFGSPLSTFQKSFFRNALTACSVAAGILSLLAIAPNDPFVT